MEMKMKITHTLTWKDIKPVHLNEDHIILIIRYKNKEQKREIYSAFNKCERFYPPKAVAQYYKSEGLDNGIRIIGKVKDIQEGILNISNEFLKNQIQETKPFITRTLDHELIIGILNDPNI